MRLLARRVQHRRPKGSRWYGPRQASMPRRRRWDADAAREVAIARRPARRDQRHQQEQCPFEIVPQQRPDSPLPARASPRRDSSRTRRCRREERHRGDDRRRQPAVMIPPGPNRIARIVKAGRRVEQAGELQIQQRRRARPTTRVASHAGRGDAGEQRDGGEQQRERVGADPERGIAKRQAEQREQAGQCQRAARRRRGSQRGVHSDDAEQTREDADDFDVRMLGPTAARNQPGIMNASGP